MITACAERKRNFLCKGLLRFCSVIVIATCTLAAPPFSYADDVKDLVTAARRGNTATVGELLARGIDVNAKINNGWTALIYASRDGYIDVVKLLLDKGADVNMKNAIGWTALMAASANGHIEVVKLLLTKNPEVNTKDNNGRTALIYAQEYEFPEIIQLLKEAGAKEYLYQDVPNVIAE
ncbi:MAG: ankyrin repeat domain-containing protein [Deltaproteobacteria bacterium]|nr:ankyrin repeat domain-containing protein [Deltaproteobacteria bacterium]